MKLLPGWPALLLLLVFPALGFGQSSSVLPANRELSRYGLERAWWSRAVIDPAQDVVQYVVVDEDNVYVQTRGGLVSAFDGETGRRLWSALLGSTTQESLPVTTNESELLIATGLQMMTVNKFTGEVGWELELTGHPSTAPTMATGRIFIGMVDGSMFAYELREIRDLFSENLLPKWSNLALLWRYRAPDAVTSSPIVTERSVTFSSLNGTVYCVSTANQGLFYQFETDGEIRTQMGHGAGALFVASEDARLFCLNAENGVRRWAFTAGVPIREQPRIIGGDVFITPVHDGMYSLRTDTGFRNWHQPEAADFRATTDEHVYASDSLGNLLILARNTDGAVLGRLPYRHLSLRIQNDRTDRIYLGTESGLIVCLREIGAEFPRFHMHPERSPILPELVPDEDPVEDSTGN
jgi:outer membrane protein assembly factor BamB